MKFKKKVEKLEAKNAALKARLKEKQNDLANAHRKLREAERSNKALTKALKKEDKMISSLRKEIGSLKEKDLKRLLLIYKLRRVKEEILKYSQDMPPEFIKVVDNHFWKIIGGGKR